METLTILSSALLLIALGFLLGYIVGILTGMKWMLEDTRKRLDRLLK